ncbi:NACHT domain-containing protein [Anabaena minutissima FACHB-250]|nr:NACHT domain-containing protein [Anabaena minutissima FACHB-250]
MSRKRLSLKASQRGKQLIQEARTKKNDQARKDRIKEKGWIEPGWDMEAIFLKEASKILEPHRDWDNFGPYAVGLATWRRFKEAKCQITAENFIAFCQVLDLNWEEIKENETDTNRDLSEAPSLAKFYGRTQELDQLQQQIIAQNCRLVTVYGMGGVGKSALVRHLVERNEIAKRYDFVIWLPLQSAPPFSEILIKLVQFLSRGEQETGNIDQIMQYLHRQRCLIVLDGWEEIIGNHSEDYTNYNLFVERVAKESHKSCLLLLSRRRPKNIERLEGQFVYSKRLGGLSYEDGQEFLRTEGLSGTDSEIEELSRRYNNPWILKRIIGSVNSSFGGDISNFMMLSIFVDEVTTDFLDRQFQALSQAEINLIYWVAIRRNTALWNQLLQDSRQLLTDSHLLQTLNDLISRHSLLDINKEEIPVIYILDPVILKYSTKRFIFKTCEQIKQVFTSGVINGFELFITHNFITEYPKDEELNQEQMRRFVKPIQQTLLAQFRSQQHVETQLNKVISLLEAQGYTSKNISHLLSAFE